MKLRSISPVLVLFGLALLAVPSAAAPVAPPASATAETTLPTTFRVAGAVEKPREWSVSQIRQDFGREIQTLRYKLKDKKYTSQVVSLLSLLQASKPLFDAKTKHPEAHYLLLAQGRDGYTVAFSLAELLPELANRQIFIALDVNGKPFEGKEAPVRLLVPQDKNPTRWIYGIASLSVVDATQIQSNP